MKDGCTWLLCGLMSGSEIISYNFTSIPYNGKVLKGLNSVETRMWMFVGFMLFICLCLLCKEPGRGISFIGKQVPTCFFVTNIVVA